MSRSERFPRHRFDPVSFVIGTVAVAAGLVVLAGGSLVDAARVIVPLGLIAVGIALLVKTGTRDTRAAPAPDAGAADDRLSGSELYDLLVPDPVESFLADLEARRQKLGADATTAPGEGTVATGTAPPSADDTIESVDTPATTHEPTDDTADGGAAAAERTEPSDPGAPPAPPRGDPG